MNIYFGYVSHFLAAKKETSESDHTQLERTPEVERIFDISARITELDKFHSRDYMSPTNIEKRSLEKEAQQLIGNLNQEQKGLVKMELESMVYESKAEASILKTKQEMRANREMREYDAQERDRKRADEKRAEIERLDPDARVARQERELEADGYRCVASHSLRDRGVNQVKRARYKNSGGDFKVTRRQNGEERFFLKIEGAKK